MAPRITIASPTPRWDLPCDPPDEPEEDDVERAEPDWQAMAEDRAERRMTRGEGDEE